MVAFIVVSFLLLTSFGMPIAFALGIGILTILLAAPCRCCWCRTAW